MPKTAPVTFGPKRTSPLEMIRGLTLSSQTTTLRKLSPALPLVSAVETINLTPGHYNCGPARFEIGLLRDKESSGVGLVLLKSEIVGISDHTADSEFSDPLVVLLADRIDSPHRVFRIVPERIYDGEAREVDWTHDVVMGFLNGMGLSFSVYPLLGGATDEQLYRNFRVACEAIKPGMRLSVRPRLWGWDERVPLVINEAFAPVINRGQALKFVLEETTRKEFNALCTARFTELQ